MTWIAIATLYVICGLLSKDPILYVIITLLIYAGLNARIYWVFHSKKRRQHMRRLIVLLAFLLMASSVYAADVTLQWDANVDGITTGYNLYMGGSSKSYGSSFDARNATTYTVTGLGEGTAYFAATAYDGNGNESAYSNEVVAHTINASSDANGTISPSGILFVQQGSSKTYTLTPTAGYKVNDVLLDGVSVKSSLVSSGGSYTYTFSTVTAPHKIAATFAKTPDIPKNLRVK